MRATTWTASFLLLALRESLLLVQVLSWTTLSHLTKSQPRKLNRITNEFGFASRHEDAADAFNRDENIDSESTNDSASDYTSNDKDDAKSRLDLNHSSWIVVPASPSPRSLDAKLGINVGSMLEPLNARDAAELKAAATEIINEKVAEGLDGIERMRKRLQRDIEQKQRQMQLTSDFNAQRESERLMDKIDTLTSAFLDTTEATRASTKIAAEADRLSEGLGVELGVWGTIGGAAIRTTGSSKSLLGSVQAAVNTEKATKPKNSASGVIRGNRPPSILMFANVQGDDCAKVLAPKLSERLQSVIPGLQVRVLKPIDTVPIGGDGAACVIFFAASFSSATTLKSSLDRLLLKTLVDGVITNPPTQLVVISSLGTERTSQMPYSMQNLMSGGKFDQRRQIEEVVIRAVKYRATEPSLDFTICKLGTLGNSKDVFQLMPGDSLDGTVDVDTALKVIEQSVAFQPAARNATLSVIGMLPPVTSQELLDDAFLKLDGPELIRIPVGNDDFDQLVTYLNKWSDLLASSGKGLTTPVWVERNQIRSKSSPGVTKQHGLQLLFLPTATGKNYLSAKEEDIMERDKAVNRNVGTVEMGRKMRKEGGIEITVETLTNNSIRIRAKRCHYEDDTVVKELSEQTILSRLKEAVEVWKNGNYLS